MEEECDARLLFLLVEFGVLEEEEDASVSVVVFAAALEKLDIFEMLDMLEMLEMLGR